MLPSFVFQYQCFYWIITFDIDVPYGWMPGTAAPIRLWASLYTTICRLIAHPVPTNVTYETQTGRRGNLFCQGLFGYIIQKYLTFSLLYLVTHFIYLQQINIKNEVHKDCCSPAFSTYKQKTKEELAGINNGKIILSDILMTHYYLQKIGRSYKT